MNKKQQYMLYRSIIESVSKTVKKILNEDAQIFKLDSEKQTGPKILGKIDLDAIQQRNQPRPVPQKQHNQQKWLNYHNIPHIEDDELRMQVLIYAIMHMYDTVQKEYKEINDRMLDEIFDNDIDKRIKNTDNTHIIHYASNNDTQLKWAGILFNDTYEFSKKDKQSLGIITWKIVPAIDKTFPVVMQVLPDNDTQPSVYVYYPHCISRYIERHLNIEHEQIRQYIRTNCRTTTDIIDKIVLEKFIKNTNKYGNIQKFDWKNADENMPFVPIQKRISENGDTLRGLIITNKIMLFKTYIDKISDKQNNWIDIHSENGEDLHIANIIKCIKNDSISLNDVLFNKLGHIVHYMMKDVGWDHEGIEKNIYTVLHIIYMLFVYIDSDILFNNSVVSDFMKWLYTNYDNIIKTTQQLQQKIVFPQLIYINGKINDEKEFKKFFEMTYIYIFIALSIIIFCGDYKINIKHDLYKFKKQFYKYILHEEPKPAIDKIYSYINTYFKDLIKTHKDMF